MRVPFLAQMAQEDCGPTCLAMILAAYGQHVPQSEVRDRCGLGRSGVTAYDLLMAAESFGLVGEGLGGVEPRDVPELLKVGPVILHWGLGHMVVCERASSRGLRILDPAKGCLEVGWPQIEKALSGVVLTFRPGPSFEKRKGQIRPIRRLLQEIQQDRLPVVALVVAGLVAQGLAVLPALAVGLAVDAGAGSPGGAALAGMVGLALAALVGGLLDLYRNLLVGRLAAAANERFYQRVLRRLLGLPLGWIQARGSGEIQARLVQIQGVLGTAAAAMLNGFTAGASAVGCFLALAWLSPPAAAYALAASIGLIAVTRSIAERERLQARPYLLLTARIGAEASEVVRARVWIQMAGLGGWASAKLLRLLESWRGSVLAATHQSRLAGFQVGLLRALVDGGMLFLAGALGVLGKATLGEVAMLVALGTVLRSSLTGLADSLRALHAAGNTMDRADDILEAVGEPRGTRRGEIDGLVEAQELMFRYWPGADPVLNGIDFRIEAGEMVGLVGKSGCGKSTLGSLIAGVRTPSSGALSLSGAPIQSWHEDELRRQVGYALQTPEILAGSVRLNLDLGRHAKDEDLWEVLNQVCLDGVVRRLGGLDALIDTGGRNLSGGERQRLALGRALVGRPRLLILDEATSALDLSLEAEIHRTLRHMAMTRLLITHRRGSLAHADRVLELSGGRIA